MSRTSRVWSDTAAGIAAAAYLFAAIPRVEAAPVAAPSSHPIRSSGPALGRSRDPRFARLKKIALFGDGFSGASTAPNAWLTVGGACLTAGNASTPGTSIPACGANAPQDAVGQGALQLTASAGFQSGMVVSTAPASTANGLQITFVDYAFSGSTPGADGMTVFLSDASQPIPTALGATGGSLGYANGTVNGTTVAGIANGYVGIALDEFGNFSNPTEGRNGGPGQIPETIAVRGAAATGYQ